MIPVQDQPEFIGDIYKQVKQEIPDDLDLESLGIKDKGVEGTKVSIELSTDEGVTQEINATVGGQ